MSIAAGVAQVREHMARAAAAAGRDVAGITLIAVSKTQPLDAVLAAYDAGVRDFGENTAQELDRKATALSARGLAVRWHFVGRLQRNKVKTVLQHAAIVHTVDSDGLAAALVARVGGAGEGPVVVGAEVLVQVNIGREPQKGGVDPDAAVGLAQRVALQPGLRLRGLMAVPPADVPPRPYFQALANLSEALRATPEGADAAALSMGMSHDFVEAIACGATMVRVGTAIFGARARREENNT